MMNNGITTGILKELGLHGMADEFDRIIMLPIQRRPSLDAAVAKMAEAEQLHRKNAKAEKLLKAARLRMKAYIEDVECSTARNLTEAELTELADCGFISRGEFLAIIGKTGCGKSYLANAIARQSCLNGLRTIYLNMNSFVDEIAQARLDGTYQKLIAKLNRNDLIVLDDFGLQPMNQDTRLALFQLLEERYGEKSVIIASQLPLDKWYSYLADSTTADAIMDRIVNNSTIINLLGDSMRGRKKRG
jgi:DNA replication protein DnaC